MLLSALLARKAEDCGHRVSLLHANYVRAFVRRCNTDSADADALVRAIGDEDLKPIQIRTERQQALQSMHRIRSQLLKKTKIASINEARGLCAEFGIILLTGSSGIAKKLHRVSRVNYFVRRIASTGNVTRPATKLLA